MVEIFIYLCFLFVFFSRFIPKREPIKQTAGIASLKANSGLNIFLSVNKAPIKSIINIIQPSNKPLKRYFCPFLFDNKNAEINADKNNEASDISSVILFGFNV